MASLPRPRGLQNDPPDLVDVPGGQGGKEIQVASGAMGPLAVLRASARAAGFKAPLFDVVSAYRSGARQAELWADALAQYGSPAAARKWVAPPESSTHQTGYAIDFYLGGQNSSGNAAALRKTKAWRWLDANADRLGWAAYDKEPWHWEYTGASPMSVSRMTRAGMGNASSNGGNGVWWALAAGAVALGIVYAMQRKRGR